MIYQVINMIIICVFWGAGLVAIGLFLGRAWDIILTIIFDFLNSPRGTTRKTAFVLSLFGLAYFFVSQGQGQVDVSFLNEVAIILIAIFSAIAGGVVTLLSYFFLFLDEAREAVSEEKVTA